MTGASIHNAPKPRVTTVRFLCSARAPVSPFANRGSFSLFSTALCSTRRRRGRHRWDALRPDEHPAVMARRSGQGMKPLAARACARPLTAPSTMTLLEQPKRQVRHQLPDLLSLWSGLDGLPSRHTLPLDSLVGSLAACPIASLRWRKRDSNPRSLS